MDATALTARQGASSVQIEILAFTRTKERFLQEGEAEYLKRLTSYLGVRVGEPPGLNKLTKLAEDRRKRREVELAQAAVGPRDVLIALDERGKQLRSVEFADLLRGHMQSGTSKVLFAIGGPSGWDRSIESCAAMTMSLGPMTFTAQFARLLLIEQVYRAMTIIEGEPYHK